MPQHHDCLIITANPGNGGGSAPSLPAGTAVHLPPESETHHRASDRAFTSGRKDRLDKLTFRDEGQVDVPAALLAGFAAGVVFVGTMFVEIRLSGKQLNDLVLLGRPITGNPETAAVAGLPIHLLNSAGLALVYAVYVRERLPGPPAVRGTLFALIENALLYPFTSFEGNHPAIRDGQVDRYWSLSSHLWTVPRHVAFGLVLGSLYERIRKN
ncbi:hypothetical protein BH23CHL4_BH23CHL4_13750 [soil metagenome]